MVQFGERKAECPNCGGPIEFKLGSSAACICPWCRHSVARTDRDLADLGKVSDLVPTAPLMQVGDAGTIAGQEFVVGGRLQLDHGRGPWDEWYIEYTRDRRWAWLAQAQGKYYVTEPRSADSLPTWEQMNPGNRGGLPGTDDVEWSVAERGRSTLVSAEGELPIATRPDMQGRFVDLEGPERRFATIDYGDGSEAPKLFVGKEVAAGDLKVRPAATGPRPTEKVDVSKLSCPTCGAPVPIVVPERTERVSCQHCFEQLDFGSGSLRPLGRAQQERIEPLIPVGAKGTLLGEQVTCIGFMERFTDPEGIVYKWREYLLHTASGYRWLLEDSGHFTWLQPARGADVYFNHPRAQHDGTTYRLFAMNDATVNFVVGEFYWRVTVGERTQTADFIAPPKILSDERSSDESIWSVGQYVPGKDIWAAFKLAGDPPRPQGVAPAQPNPHGMLFPSIILLATVVLLCLLGAALDLFGGRVLYDSQIAFGAAGAPVTKPGMLGFSTSVGTSEPREQTAGPFRLRGPTSLRIELKSNVDNEWVGIGGVLADESSGQRYPFAIETAHFSGYDFGEYWKEGSRGSIEFLDRIATGNYTLQLTSQWRSYASTSNTANKPTATTVEPPHATLQIIEGRRSAACLCCSFILLFLPWVFFFFRRRAFEAKRNLNSSF